MRSDVNNIQYILVQVIIVPVVVVVAIPFILDVWLMGVPAGVTQEEVHTGFLQLSSAVVCR